MADNTTLNTGSGGDTIATDDIGSVKYQRIKLVSGADGTNDGDIAKANPLPVWPRHDGATRLQFWATGTASGTTGTETAITLSRSPSPGGTVTTGASWTPTSGKRFRISSIVFASRGNTTATAQVTTFSIRVNAAGATATTSPVLLAARTATPATALAWDRFTVMFEGDGPEMVGDGTLTFGVTANAVFVTNAPTWDVLITGYEY